MVPITYCPPMPAHTFCNFDPYQHFKPNVNRVERTSFDGDGIVNNKSLSFQDTGFMSTRASSVVGHLRRLPTPIWALDNRLLRGVLVRFWERQAHIVRGVGTESERLRAAHQKLLACVPALLARMDRLCAEFVACNDQNRKVVLGRAIAGTDSTILHIRRGPPMTAMMVYSYYRQALDSPGVAEQLHQCKAVFVRQVLHRLSKAARELENPSLPTPKRHRLRSIKRAHARVDRREKKLAALVAERDLAVACAIEKARERLAARAQAAQMAVEEARARLILIDPEAQERLKAHPRDHDPAVRKLEYRVKLSRAAKRQWSDPEQRAKQVAAMCRAHRFLGWTAAERQSAMARDVAGSKNPSFGKPGTRRGAKWSPEQHAKHAATMRRKRAEKENRLTDCEPVAQTIAC